VVVAHTIAECREIRQPLGRVAFVPTMGALHEGHLSLIKSAWRHSQRVVVSIFVNPTQFGPGEDFQKYPRPIEQDLEFCRQAGVDLVFVPTTQEMYPPGLPPMSIELPGLGDILEGKHRPGHFSGVCQVVAKLFDIVQPQVAIFGQKDFQQLRIIGAMTSILAMPVQVVGLPTVREPDGLARSSRNRYLTPEQRKRALYIFKSLERGRAELQGGTRQANKITAAMRATMLDLGPPGNPLGRVEFAIDYAVAADPMTLKNIDNIAGPLLLAIAARVGSTRLIDNYYLTESGELIEQA
jgi:pantoate--beta-alanine ligase